VKLVEEADIDSLTVRNWWSRVHIVKRTGNGNGGSSNPATSAISKQAVQSTLPPLQVTPSPAAASSVTAEAPVEKKSSTAKEISSPMVGTFYTAPEPNAPPFVGLGQKVRKGQVLCIVEAMKLMNEIEAEFDCTIVERLVENAEPVEYGTPIFLVEPA